MPTHSQNEAENCAVCGSPRSELVAQGLCVQCLAQRFIEPATEEKNSSPPDAAFPPEFECIDVLGRGGMGTVYLAYQRSLARYVAMKQLSTTLQKNVKARDRFLHEARAAARLSHQGIVPILETGIYEEQGWYTMEYVEGGDLAEAAVKRGGKLPWQESVLLIAKVADAIDYAHKAGVVHRDLKPSNILLDSAGEPKVCDFGLAWIAGQEASGFTGTGEILGTPSYLSPDALSGGAREFDARASDIYSLGAVLFHLIAGRPPFIGDHPLQVLSAIAKDRAPRLADIIDEGTIPAFLDDICARCLEKRPEDRFSSAKELAQALRSCAEPGQQPIAKTSKYRNTRNRVLVIAALLATVAAGVYFIVTVRNHRSPLFVTAQENSSSILAVMPPQALTADETTTLLAAGLHDELVSVLTGISKLRVVTDRSVRASKKDPGDLKAIKEALGADVVLYIRVQKWQDMIRVAVQLVDTKDGNMRWSELYDRHETNLLNLQTDIATQVAIHLKVQLTPGEAALARARSSVAPAAQKLYIKAKTLANDASAPTGQFKEAEQLLGQAIEADPNFADAYAKLSGLHTEMYNWGLDRSDRRLRLGLEMAQKAVQLNPDLPEGEIALGNYFVRGSRDYISARPHFERALQLSANASDALSSLAFIERRQGDFKAAAKHYASALELDPLNPILAYNTADTYLRLREFDTASAKLEQALLRMPGHIALVKLKGNLLVSWKGDLGPMRDDILYRDPSLPTADLFLMDKIEWLILEHQPEKALVALRESKLVVLEGQTVYFTRAGYEALLLQLAGQPNAAREAATRALTEITPALEARPNDARILLHAGQMQAILGNVAEGERLARRSITKGDLACADAFDRGLYLRSLAILFSNAGEDTKAREMLKLALDEPNQLSLHYIQLHPSLMKYSRDFK